MQMSRGLKCQQLKVIYQQQDSKRSVDFLIPGYGRITTHQQAQIFEGRIVL